MLVFILWILKNFSYIHFVGTSNQTKSVTWRKTSSIWKMTGLENILYVEELPIPAPWLVGVSHLQHEDLSCSKIISELFWQEKSIFSSNMPFKQIDWLTNFPPSSYVIFYIFFKKKIKRSINFCPSEKFLIFSALSRIAVKKNPQKTDFNQSVIIKELKCLWPWQNQMRLCHLPKTWISWYEMLHNLSKPNNSNSH